MEIDEQTIWKRIQELEGEQFETKTGKPFVYKIENNWLIPDRTEFPLEDKEFFKIIDLLPVGGPGEITKLVMGSSYVWAILHDRRIRKQDW